MPQVYNFLMGLASQCSHLSHEELLMVAMILTMLIALILTVSGRQLT